MMRSYDSAFVRLITDDAQLLLPVLLERDVSFLLTSRRHVDVRGMGAPEVARIAALCNARVTDLQTVPAVADVVLGHVARSTRRT